MGGGSWSCRGSFVFLYGAIAVCFAALQLHIAGCGAGELPCGSSCIEAHCGPTASSEGCLEGNSLDPDCCASSGNGFCMQLSMV